MAARKNDDGTFRHVCHLAVVGLGLTISHTLLSSPKNNKRFHPQFRDYKNQGGKNLSPEQNAIILSLQDGVTSKPDKAGGLGMQELISNIASLGGGVGKDKMCIAIISGRNCIRILAPHLLREDKEDTPRQCWLNSNNDPHAHPDPDTVSDIDIDFPGTCISIRFELDPTHLQKHQMTNSELSQQRYPIEDAKYKEM